MGFSEEKTVTIGIGGLHRLNPDLRGRLDWYLRLKGLDSREFKVKGQYLPAGDYRVVPGKANVLLCGDAASAVDPISGERIPFAMQTGAAAGNAVARSLAEPAGAERLGNLLRGLEDCRRLNSTREVLALVHLSKIVGTAFCLGFQIRTHS